MAFANPNRLLVEGDEEKRLIPQFINEHVVWGDKPEQWVVQIEQFGGVDGMLKPGTIEAELKIPRLKRLGIIIDANDHIDSRWARVRERCLRVLDDFPEDLPADGLIHQSARGLRVGVWVMPDNRTRGMLETFLGQLLNPSLAPLWAFAQDACLTAKVRGAPFKDAHIHKANIHTYLSWLDPPGRQLHIAVIAEAIDAKRPLGRQFVDWFMNLYELTPRTAPLIR